MFDVSKLPGTIVDKRPTQSASDKQKAERLKKAKDYISQNIGKHKRAAAKGDATDWHQVTGGEWTVGIKTGPAKASPFLDLGKGKFVKVSNLNDVETTYDVIGAAVKAGELDEQIMKSITRTRKK